MATVNLGKVRVTFGGSFDSTLSYPLLTIVDNPYKVKYISKTNVPINSSLSDTTYWEALSGQFVEQYQGDGTTDPTTRVDGSALKTGDLFFNTTLSQMRVYDGTVWKSAGSTVNGTSQRQTFTATAGQTTFTITGGYEPGFADVYLNGIKLENGVDVDVSSGTDVVLTTGADAGDIVDVVAYGDFKIANTYTKAEVDAKDALKLDSSVYTAADVLTKVKAVDGAGSDLDADLLDGKNSSVTSAADTIPIRDTNAAIAGKNQCTAWAVVNFDGTNIVIQDSYNISSITRTSTGQGVITFVETMLTTNYSIIGSDDGYTTSSAQVNYDSSVQTKNLTSLGYRNTGTNGTAYDFKEAIVVVFGGK